MRLRLIAASAAMLVFSIAAHADTVQSYVLQATLGFGATANGNILFDETTGQFSGGTLYATLEGFTYAFNVFDGSSSFDTVTSGTFYDDSGDTFGVVIPGISNTGYAGGNLCSNSYTAGCDVKLLGSGGSYATYGSFPSADKFLVRATAGSLTSVATPEPSSLALVGTGTLGVLNLVRRRLSPA